MKVIREITIYQKEGEELIDSFLINLPKDVLIKILNVDLDDDPDIYKVYSVNEKQYADLSRLDIQLPIYDFNTVEVFYECSQA
jgi:hypothetical protein